MDTESALAVHEVIVQPRAPLIVRDGRPFTADAGAQAVTLPWPLPGTLAGALRTRIGTDLAFDWQGDGPDRARRITVQGPLMLARWPDSESAWQVYLAQPRDALLVHDTSGQPVMHALRPFGPGGGAGCDLPHPALQPLQVEESGKSLSGYSYWPLRAYLRWLSDARPQPQAPPLRCLGPLPRETRVHVAINRETRTGREGALFSTVGLAFADQPQPARAGQSDEQPAHALLCRVDGATSWSAATSYLQLGGERRLAELHPVDAAGSLWPACPPELRDALAGTPRLRLTLVTPALFTGGWRPGWLDDDLIGAPPAAPALRLRLVAAATGRHEPVSGWDLQRGKPKAARYMVPAGSVYFCEVVEGELSAAAIERLWLSALSDLPQDRADGFGLSVMGVW